MNDQNSAALETFLQSLMTDSGISDSEPAVPPAALSTTSQSPLYSPISMGSAPRPPSHKRNNISSLPTPSLDDFGSSTGPLYVGFGELLPELASPTSSNNRDRINKNKTHTPTITSSINNNSSSNNMYHLPPTPAASTPSSHKGSSVPETAINPGTEAAAGASAEGAEEFPEIAYVTDECGNILSLQEEEWNDIPIPPHIERCMSPNIIGRNLFEFISDPKVQSFSRHIVYMLCSGQQQRYQYYWFCDSPDIERKMYMTVSALTGFGSAKLILWVSKIISEKILAEPQNYLSSPALTPNESASPTEEVIPTNTVCSFCKRIMVMCEDLSHDSVSIILASSTVVPKPLLSHGPVPILGLRGKMGEQVQISTSGGIVNHLWLTPHQYYVVAGKGDNIRIRHGICEVCYNEIGFTFFPPGSFVDGVPSAVAKAAGASGATTGSASSSTAGGASDKQQHQQQQKKLTAAQKGKKKASNIVKKSTLVSSQDAVAEAIRRIDDLRRQNQNESQNRASSSAGAGVGSSSSSSSAGHYRHSYTGGTS
ncbi:hypothetical protein HDU97_009593 [Phlyctochytrium planicorne]|nr:hypothetical protein HDU97_009593 [Phlyctochytrium planicorne]